MTTEDQFGTTAVKSSSRKDETVVDETSKLYRDEDKSGAEETKSKYTRRQWTILVLITGLNFGSGMCFSLQGPFYPREAEAKGMTASQYGFVFGVFEMVDFIVCPIYGKFIKYIGPKLMLNSGITVMACCAILFGFLNHVPAGTPFIALSFMVRIIEAAFHGAYLTASFAVMCSEFSRNVASAFSVLGTSYGLGMIIGPTIGGLLYALGGYTYPFVVVGGVVLFLSCITFCFLPTTEQTVERSHSFISLLKIPSISISYFTVSAAAFSFGFNAALLEPHLRQFDLTPTTASFMFVITGVVYAGTSPIWGWLADKHFHPKLLSSVAGSFVVVAYLLIGPAPYLPVEPQLWLVIVALIFHGVGAGGEVVTVYLDASRETIKRGFPNNVETFGMITGLWASAMALGSFIGPTLSGLLTDTIGFRVATQVIVGLHIMVNLCNTGELGVAYRCVLMCYIFLVMENCVFIRLSPGVTTATIVISSCPKIILTSGFFVSHKCFRRRRKQNEVLDQRTGFISLATSN